MMDLAPYRQFTLITGIAGDEWASAGDKIGHELGIPVQTVVIGPGREVTDLYYDWAKLREVEESGVAAGPTGQAHRLARNVVAAGPGGRVADRADDHPGPVMADHAIRSPNPAPARAVRLRRGRGESEADALTELGARRVMVIASRGQRVTAEAILAGVPVAHWCEEVVMHVPVEVAQRARDAAAGPRRRRSDQHRRRLGHRPGEGGRADHRAADRRGPDDIRRLGGHPVWGLTEAARKTTGTDAQGAAGDCRLRRHADPVAARRPERRVGAQRAGALRGLDVGAAGRPDRTRRWRPKAIRALRDGLSAVVDEPTGLDGREQTLYGAYLSAVAFASAGSGLHHKICHVLGGMFDLPHAPDARRRAAARAGVQRTRRARGRTAHRRGVRRAERA